MQYVTCNILSTIYNGYVRYSIEHTCNTLHIIYIKNIIVNI